ncbi:MAG: response regulator [Spirochaetota bacterium]|nr:response regulator [Spirochaetota bacterium]
MDHKPKILVVDDEDRNLRLMEALLIPIGYDVILANDGEEALGKVKEDQPDVILLDIMMPNMDGYEVARRLKRDETTRIIPIVMVSALKDMEDRVKALEAGADDYFTKPVDKLELRARVESILKVKEYNDYMLEYQKRLEAEVAKRTSQLYQSIEKLKSASLDTIYRLSRAAEYKDEDTGTHILRMSSYSSLIAHKMNMDDELTEAIIYAAQMHDLGKIGVPDRILLKESNLTPTEWDIMKQHTIIGGQILEGSDSEIIQLAEVIARTHHEKWDGSGYPLGLRGEEIPIAGRITAIADVFDAMISNRPYKAPIPIDTVYEIIYKNRGNHFDPEVVDVFMSIKEEIFSIKEKYTDDSIPPILNISIEED